MAWTIEYASSFAKAVKGLDKTEAKTIRSFIEDRLVSLDDPRQIGSPLKGKFDTLWRYRIGDYRIICDLQDDRCVVLVLAIGHRKEVYR